MILDIAGKNEKRRGGNISKTSAEKEYSNGRKKKVPDKKKRRGGRVTGWGASKRKQKKEKGNSLNSGIRTIRRNKLASLSDPHSENR